MLNFWVWDLDSNHCNLNPGCRISTQRETKVWGQLKAWADYKIFFPNSASVLISSSVLSILSSVKKQLPLCRRREMWADRYLQLSLLTQLWVARRWATAGSVFPFTHTHTRLHTPLIPLQTLTHPFLTFTCQAAWLIRAMFTVKKTSDTEGRWGQRVRAELVEEACDHVLLLYIHAQWKKKVQSSCKHGKHAQT